MALKQDGNWPVPSHHNRGCPQPPLLILPHEDPTWIPLPQGIVLEQAKCHILQFLCSLHRQASWKQKQTFMMASVWQEAKPLLVPGKMTEGRTS